MFLAGPVYLVIEFTMHGLVCLFSVSILGDS